MNLASLMCLSLLLGQSGDQDASKLYQKSKPAVVTVTCKREGKEISGSAFYVDYGRYLITASHVINAAIDLRVNGDDENIFKIVYDDKASDVAVIRMKSHSDSFLMLRGEKPPPVGSKVFVISNPLGFLEGTLSEGIVSGFRPASSRSLVQFSAPVSHGSSGAPVLDGVGRVVAMVDSSIEAGNGLYFGISSYDIGMAVDKARAALRKLLTPGVIGQLGQVVEDAKVYRNRNKESRVLSDTKVDQYLVVNLTDDSDWLAVTMVDGSTGYIQSKCVAQLPYDVPGNVGSDLITLASGWVGVPYSESSEDIGTGASQTSLVRLLLKDCGFDLPQEIQKQVSIGTKIEKVEDLQPGDRLYFGTEKRAVSGGLFLGYFDNGLEAFLYVDKKLGEVSLCDLRRKEYRSSFVTARRGGV